MRLLQLENWPILCICAGMIAAAVIDWWKFKVPNRLTFPLIFAGWALGLFHNIVDWYPGLCPEALRGGTGGLGATLSIMDIESLPWGAAPVPE